MSDPLVRAFFIGRAVAETLSEQVESVVTNTLSEIGKFDAEQRENMRQFANEVMERANREEEVAMRDRPASSNNNHEGGGAASPVAISVASDLQATIDGIRAEIAHLRAELQQYRNSQS
ncbi:MAG: hypothetical protein VKJ64_15785 [Leptolyngbyaceae bacterium]|nr:hypothetical protein [Leptolyngbyaceae bacterium]